MNEWKKQLKNSQRDNISCSYTHAKRSAFRTVHSDFFSRHRSRSRSCLVLILVLVLRFSFVASGKWFHRFKYFTYSLTVCWLCSFFSPSPGCSCITSTLLACGVYGLFIVWHIVRQGNNSINKNGKRREGKWETQGDALIWCNVCDQTTEEADSVKKGEAHRKKLSCAFCDKLFWLENIIKYSTHKCAYANAMELAGSLAFLGMHAPNTSY